MRLLLLGFLFLLPLAAHAQQETVLAGRVTDAHGAPLPGVSVFVPGTLAATFTGADGAYLLEDVLPGEVEVRFSLAGYRVHNARVLLAPGAATRLDVALGRRPFWERALLFSTDPEAEARAAPFAIGRTLEADGLPARTVGEAAGLVPGVIRDERSDTLTFLGGTRVARALDGVPLPAPMPLPWTGVRLMTLYAEHTPATQAGGRDALLDLTTHDGSERQLFAEALASPRSPVGLKEFRGAAGTPLLGGRMRVFVSGSVARQDDFAPSAVPFAQLKSDVLGRILTQPQEIAIVRDGDPSDVRFLPLPGGLPDTISLADLRARMDVPAGYDLTRIIRSAAAGLSEADFEETRVRRNASAETRSLLVRAGAAIASLDLDFTYAAADDARDVWSLSQTLFRDGAFGRMEARQRFVRGEVGRDIGPVALRLTAASYRDRATTFDPRFSRGIENTLRYGEVSEAANPTARAYRRFRDQEDVLLAWYVNGVLPEESAMARGIAWLGAAGVDYAQDETDATFLRLESSADVRGHALTLGVERQHRLRRAITFPRTADLAKALNTYQDPAYQDLHHLDLNSVYYGYDYLGLARANDESIHAFARSPLECFSWPYDSEACRAVRGIAPLEVTRLGLYAADRFGVGPLRLDVGLRYERFGNNRLVPSDPYALGLIRRARDEKNVPAGIDPDYAVYYRGQINIVGFRSRDGRFFDATGQPIQPQDLPWNALQEPTNTGFFDEEGALVKAPVHGVWQPRVAFGLAVAPRASVWLSFNRTADLPGEALFNATLQNYERTTLGGSRLLPNAALRPEVATTYATGGQGSLGPMAFALNLSQRWIDHVAVPVTRVRAYPREFDTYASEGRLRVRSVGAQVRLARTRGLALEASYTLSRVRGRQPQANVLQSIFWWPPDSAPDPEQGATRHVFEGLAGYRTEAGAGPRVLGIAPFERLHATVAVEAWSGASYIAFASPEPVYSSVRVSGFNGYHTLPWSALVHVQAERGFAVGRHTLTLFAQVRNLFDTANTRRVYGATGRPADDGFLDTEKGQQEYPAGSINRFYYETRLRDPLHYGLPREVRLGLRVGW